jgi:hypothetical protein
MPSVGNSSVPEALTLPASQQASSKSGTDSQRIVDLAIFCVLKRNGIALRISRNIAMRRISIESGRGGKSDGRCSRAAFPMLEPEYSASLLALGRFGVTGVVLGALP